MSGSSLDDGCVKLINDATGHGIASYVEESTGANTGPSLKDD